MEGGEDFLEIDGKLYPIWVNSERPLTIVETAMLRWIKVPNNPTAQQIATQASVAFANAMEQKEAQQIMEILERRKQPNEESQPEIPAVPTSIQRFRQSLFVEKIAIKLATLLSAERYNIIIQGLLPEVLAQNKSNKHAMNFVLEKWRKAADNEIKTIAKLQDNAIWLVEHGAFVGALVLGGLVLLLIVPILRGVLLVIFLCAFVFWWFRTRFSPQQKREGITSRSLKQTALRFWDNLNR